MLNPRQEPLPKPVKIRIMSNGKEHSSLDSLCQDFNVEDVCKLLDGRLVNWLKKINQSTMADKVTTLQETQELNELDKYNKLIRIFFPDMPGDTLKEIADYWYDTDEFRKKAMDLYILLVHSDREIAIELYNNKRDRVSDWESVFRIHECAERPFFYYLHGEFLADKGKRPEAIKLLNEAENLGIVEATTLLNHLCTHDSSDQILIKYWRVYSKNPPYLKKKLQNEFKGNDVALMMFDMLDMLEFLQQLDNGIWNAAEILTQRLTQGLFRIGPKDKDRLYQEKVFCLVIYTRKCSSFNFKESFNEMVNTFHLDEDLAKTYPPLRCILDLPDVQILSQDEKEALKGADIKRKFDIIIDHLIDFQHLK